MHIRTDKYGDDVQAWYSFDPDPFAVGPSVDMTRFGSLNVSKYVTFRLSHCNSILTTYIPPRREGLGCGFVQLEAWDLEIQSASRETH